MVKFNAATFKTTPEMSPRKQFLFEVEDILRHVRNLKPGLRVGWLREKPYMIAIAFNRLSVGCMTVISTAAWGERKPYGDMDVAVYDMSLQDVIDSWEADDGKASRLASYPESIKAGCKRLGWIAEPDDEDDWDSYI